MSQGSSGTRQMPPDIALIALSLSAREEEIIVRVAEGKTNIDISRILGISPFTVKNHVQRIIKKLGASNRTEAAVRYFQGNLQQVRAKNDGRIAGSIADSAESTA